LDCFRKFGYSNLRIGSLRSVEIGEGFLKQETLILKGFLFRILQVDISNSHMLTKIIVIPQTPICDPVIIALMMEISFCFFKEKQA
jgi:hypothetical protein